MTPQFHLRRAIASDLDTVLALERAAHLAPHWPPAAYAEILAAPMGPSGEGDESGASSIQSGAPFIPRSLRNEWETTAHSAGRINSDEPPLDKTIQRCLFVAETNEQIAGFAVGLLQPGAPFISRSLRNEWETVSVTSGRDHIHQHTDASAREHIAELESVVVSANSRRAGIGRALCLAVLDWSRSQGATEVVLEVRAHSAAAVALYASLGFTLSACRPRYYRDPDDDALLMRMVLL